MSHRFWSGRRGVALAFAAAAVWGAGACASGAPGDVLLPSSGQGAVDDAGPSSGASTSPGSVAGSEESPGGAMSMEDASLAFVECMRENGVEMDDPEPGGGIRLHVEPDTAAIVEAAQEICQPIMDAAAPDGLNRSNQDPEQYERMLAAAQCMRDKGYDYPDPEMDSSGRVTQSFRLDASTGVDPDQAQADREACQAEAGFETPADAEGGTFNSKEG